MNKLKYYIKYLILWVRPLFLIVANLYLWWQLRKKTSKHLAKHNITSNVPIKRRGRVYQYGDIVEIRVNQKRYLFSAASRAYTFDIIKFFDQYVDSVEGEIDENGFEVYDFSQVKLHKIKNDQRSLYYYLIPEMQAVDLDYLHFFKIRPGDFILDAGSFAGLTAARFAEKVGTHGRVICLEPDPFNYELLMRNIKHLKLSNVVAYPYALWNKTGEKLRFLADRGTGSTLTPTPSRVNPSFIMVQTTSLLTLMQEGQIQKGFDLLKLDVEGAEYAIFSEIGEFFAQCKPRQIILEVHPDAQGCAKPHFFVDILRRYNYDTRMMVSGQDILVGGTLNS